MRLFGRKKNKLHSIEKRKTYSEKLLKSQGVTVNRNLPFTCDNESCTTRKPSEVVRRLFILSIIRDTVHQHMSSTEAIAWFNEKNLWEYVSPSEKHFLESTPSQQETIEMSWRAESLNVLFWALGYVDTLSTADKLCSLDNAHAQTAKDFDSIDDFLKKAKLISSEKIFDELDYTYRLHWAVRDASLTGNLIPNNYNPALVYERHYTLNWLTNYAESADWDDISTDT